MNAQPNLDRFTRRLGELREYLDGSQPEEIANRAGCSYAARDEGGGIFRLHLWDREVGVLFPEWLAVEVESGKPLPDIFQAVLLYYFHIAGGGMLTGRLISFADLPDGRFYARAFQGYTGDVLSRHFGNDTEAFAAAAQAAGGEPYPLGDSAFIFQALPRLRLGVVYWQGDEDFPPNCQVLFDENSSDYQSTDGLAILGSMLIQRIRKAAEGLTS